MPIIIPQDLPARKVLESENVFTMGDVEARRQDIRSLQVALLNLMPTKIDTETQIARMLANSPLQVELTLLQTATHRAGNTSAEHLLAFYQTWEQVRHKRFDGFIVTGAPVETMPWRDVDYWDELRQIFDWVRAEVRSAMFICWGAQAALQHFYGVEKHLLPSKRFGIFPHRIITPHTKLMRGQDDLFHVPVSRHTEVRAEDVRRIGGLQVLAESEESGLHLLWHPERHWTFTFNHPEYDPETLGREYRRDVDKGLPMEVPKYYFPDNDPQRPPVVRWRSHAHLLFTNWLNYEVYQPGSLDRP